MDWLLQLWNQLPPEWQAILKWIFDKHLGDTIKILGLIVTLPLWKWLWKLLWKPFWNWRKRSRSIKILAKRLPDYPLAQIKSGIQYYIWPDCQDVDPTQLDEIRNSQANRKALCDRIDDLMKEDSVFKHIIILGDTGMGKTSFLLNYFVRHLRNRKKQFEMELIPLNMPELKQKLDKINSSPQDTILLLDAFDEDKDAIINHSLRLTKIVALTKNFYKIVITCRTQFFPRDEELPKETELIRPGPTKLGDSGIYVFYKLYLSPFNDKQVTAFLKRRFPFWKYNCRHQAREIVNNIKELAARPLLLTYIDDLINSDNNITKASQIYQIMINAWLVREKKFVKKTDELLKFSKELAVELFANREKYPAERIPYVNIEPLARQFGIKLAVWQLTNRSLLNRDAAGNYKFAHRSILEFLFAQQVIEKKLYQTTWRLWTNQIKKFLIEQDWNQVKYYIYLPEPKCITIKPEIDKQKKVKKPFNSIPFQLAIYPITNLQFELFDPKHQRCEYSDQDDQPVVNVSWEDAVKYCEWLSQQTGKTYRLPTEAEWEYAASGGGKRKYPWGNEEPTPDRANYNASKIGKTTPVGSYPAGKTPEGLFDMAGNVWEWCQNWYDDKQKYRVVRGGCFGDFFLVVLRGSYRDRVYPLGRDYLVGFRVVCVA